MKQVYFILILISNVAVAQKFSIQGGGFGFNGRMASIRYCDVIKSR